MEHGYRRCAWRGGGGGADQRRRGTVSKYQHTIACSHWLAHELLSCSNGECKLACVCVCVCVCVRSIRGLSEVYLRSIQVYHTHTHTHPGLGLNSSHVCVKINSRKLLAAVLHLVGIKGEGEEGQGVEGRVGTFEAVCVALDKLGKIGSEAVCADLVALGVTEEQAATLVAVVSCKSAQELKCLVGSLDAPVGAVDTAWSDGQARRDAVAAFHVAVEEVETLIGFLAAQGAADWVLFDPSVVRGLVSCLCGIVLLHAFGCEYVSLGNGSVFLCSTNAQSVNTGLHLID